MDEEYDGMECGNYGLNEMTQDVIEWDDGKNIDLIFRSPGSDVKSTLHPTTEKSQKPESNDQTESFKSVKRKLDPKLASSATEVAEKEIDAIFNSLKRHKDASAKTNQQPVQHFHSSATTLAQRHRRRRMDAARESRTPPKVSAVKCSTPVTNAPVLPQNETAVDDFANLLQAMATPVSTKKTRSSPRVPLSRLDNHAESTPRTDSATSLDSKSSSDSNPTRFPQPPVPIPNIPKLRPPFPSEPNFTEKRQDETVTKNDSDEFDEIDFSDDDFAKIDSLTQPQATKSHSTKKPIPIQSRKPPASARPIPPTSIENRKNSGNPMVTNSDSEDFGEFPSDIDFEEIDAMVSSQSNPQKPASPSSKICSQPKESKETDTAKGPNAQDGTKTTSAVCETKSCNQDEEDEFGDFPTDFDFDKMDAMVATECAHSKTVYANGSKSFPQHSESENRKTPITEVEDDDEFGDFPDDFDFASLDRVVKERMESKAKLVEIDPNRAVRNNRKRQTDGELSFMNFSRYKVLSVANDERMGVKTLQVAIWKNSMLRDGDEEKKIHRDGTIKGFHGSIFGQTIGNSEIPKPTVEDGLIYLCGEWSFTPVVEGDIINICSLTGQFETNVTALPIVLHSYPPPGSDFDDLILVLHPDMLLSPSIISETASCNRRAALKSKLGSTGLSSKSAFVGTMRHGLFEACMKSSEFGASFAQRTVQNLIRQKAEMLIGCNVSESETYTEVLNVLPMIQEFAGQYTGLRKDVMRLSSLGKPVGGVACHPDIRLLGKKVHSVEESIVSTAIGLKGSIDTVMETEFTTLGHKHDPLMPTNTKSGPQQSLMCFELKTGHNQTAQNVHMAQLSLYTFMLQSRYGADVQLDGNRMIGSQRETNFGMRGAAPGGILLYLNEKGHQISHVSPQLNEVKTLMSQRNVVANDSRRASRPRGISLAYDDGDRGSGEECVTAKLLPAPAADLPELKSSSHSCKRCFSNRECMLYAASDPGAKLESQRDLVSQFTGHLNEDDLAYFRKWDRLIDIEADASSSTHARSWLVDSRTKESENGESISGLMFDPRASYQVGTTAAILCFVRKPDSSSQSSLESLNLAPGSNVTLSTDGNLLEDFVRNSQVEKKQRNQMHVAKGSIDRISGDRVFVSTSNDEFVQVKILISHGQEGSQNAPLFRLDKNTNSVGTGTLRWNLINFLTGDYAVQTNDASAGVNENKRHRLSWLRDVVIRLKSPEFAEETQSALFGGIDRKYSGCNLVVLSKEYSHFNDAQQRAIRRVMTGRDYTLIQGLPGTGKTSVLAFLARLLVAQGCRVLITAYTHSAVDNIMLKLMEKGLGTRKPNCGTSELVRVGQARSCHQNVRPILHSEIARGVDKIREKQGHPEQIPPDNDVHPSPSALKSTIASARIVGVSALSLPRSPLLTTEHFDVVIIDEAGQMNEPTSLGALSAADSFVLVGDHKQLPPLVSSAIAESGGYGISLLKRLAEKHPHAIAPLTMQYRMNEAICKISSESVYGGLMKCGNDNVRSQKLCLPGFPSQLPKLAYGHQIDWLSIVVDPERPVVFLDTDNIRLSATEGTKRPKLEALEGKIGGHAGGSIVNRTEATLVRYIITGLHSCGHDLSEIGVISPFRAQVRILEENPTVRSWKNEGLELSTIDRYQGRDKATIVLSLVRSNEKNGAGRLLQDSRRLNVALTRAKCKLIVIGSHATLGNGSTPLKPILNRMKLRNQRIQPPENAMSSYKIR